MILTYSSCTRYIITLSIALSFQCYAANKKKQKKLLIKTIGTIDTRIGRVYLKAVQDENIPKIEVLLEIGVHVDRNLPTSNNPLNFPALFWAVKRNQKRMVSFFLENGADPNHRCYVTRPLHQAVSQNHTSIVKELLKYSASTNTTDHHHKTPLCCVMDEDPPSQRISIKKRLNMAKILLAHGAEINPKKSQPPLWNLCSTKASEKYLKLAALLISRGADPNIIYNGTNCFQKSDSLRVRQFIEKERKKYLKKYVELVHLEYYDPQNLVAFVDL